MARWRSPALIAISATILVCTVAHAQSEPSSISICDDPAYAGTADYTHYCSAPASSGGGAPAGGGGGGLTADQQMGMAMMGVMAPVIEKGIHQLIYGDPAARAKAQAEANQRLQEQNQKLDAARDELLGRSGGLAIKSGIKTGTAAYQDQPPYAPPELPLQIKMAASRAPAQASPPAAPSAPAIGPTADEGYVRGAKDAADCMPQNSGGYCVGGDPKKTAACVASYQRGFALHEPAATATLRAAYDEGVAARTSGKAYSAFSHPTQGACGVRQASVYTAGFYGWPFTTIGR